MQHLVWNIDPVAISFGSVRVFWYGILFATAILSGLEFMKWVYRLDGRKEQELDSMFIYVVIGIVVGARLGHCFFYEPAFYLAHPLKIFAVWEGGLASHGGGLGVIIGLYFYVRKYKINFLWLLDRIAIVTALFGFFVRMGNFMNSEIIGKPSELPWAIIFSRVDNLPRHPAQLYEGISYLAIFFILTYIYKKCRTRLENGYLFGLFLTLVFSVRFLVEIVKVKQADYDTSFLMMSTGQALSIPFFIFGLFLIIKNRHKK